MWAFPRWTWQHPLCTAEGKEPLKAHSWCIHHYLALQPWSHDPVSRVTLQSGCSLLVYTCNIDRDNHISLSLQKCHLSPRIWGGFDLCLVTPSFAFSNIKENAVEPRLQFIVIVWHKHLRVLHEATSTASSSLRSEAWKYNNRIMHNGCQGGRYKSCFFLFKHFSFVEFIAVLFQSG